MLRVRITPSARLDLLDIWKYIARDSSVAADRVIGQIRANFQKIAEMPGIGHVREELGPTYRVWSVYSYLVVYRPDANPVQIIRVVSGYRDLERLEL
jgi:plasmid stabilization system protein ParE